MPDNTTRVEYDSPFKNRVVGAIKAGKTIREAAALFGCPSSAAGRFWKNYKTRGTTHNLRRSGRPQKFQDRGKRLLLREAVKHRRLCLRALGKSINPNVSGSTVRRVLADAGYHRRVARHVPHLRKVHIDMRLRWAKQFSLWRLNHWQHVIWSDESYFNIGDNKGRIYVTRRPDETYADDCVIWSFNQSTVRAMVWGCFAYNYKGPLIILDYPGGASGGMNSQRYIEQVLDATVSNVYNKLKGMRRYMYFQQDNASCHKSKTSMRWFSRNHIKLFSHPPSSPDLNPIENLWSILKNHIRSRVHQPTSTEELKQAIQEAWDSLTIDDINGLVRSMPDRVKAVLAAKGGHTSY